MLETMSLAIGTMIAAEIFVLPGLAIEKAGYGIIWAFLIAGVITLFSALSYAELASAYPKDGGGYMFCYEAFGSFWGFMAGWSTWLGHTVKVAFCAEGFSIYFNNFIYDTGSHFWTAAIVALLLTILNIFGTKKVITIELFLNLGKILLLLIFISVALSQSSFESVTALKPQGLNSIIAATALLYSSYFGYSVVTNVGGEVKNPGKVIPRTIIYSMLFVAIIYIAVAIGVLGSGIRTFNESSVGDASVKFLGSGGGLIIAFGALLATLSAANANLISAAKISSRMAEEDQLNKLLVTKNKRFNTPHRAIILNLFIILGTLMLGDVTKIVTVAIFILLLSMILVNLAVIKLRRKHPHHHREFKVPFYPVTPILGALSSLVLMFVLPPAAILLGIGLLAIGFIFYEVRKTPVEKVTNFIREHISHVIHKP